jgi:DNA-binding LytR/AlgR family response regulator
MDDNIINVLIIEDEKLASQHLEKQIASLEMYNITILGSVNSVKNSIKWFLKNEKPDLIFMDIDLGDGLSFEIFEVVDIDTPIIFTTAYDEYAIKAFKVNSIDYLLKPIDKEDLEGALSKFSNLTQKEAKNISGKVQDIQKYLSPEFKERFIIKIGEHIKSVPTNTIGYFFSRDKATYACTSDKRTYLLDYTLDTIESMLNPAYFFRINRKYVVSFTSINDIIAYSNSRLRLILINCDDSEVIVARDRVGTFKQWLDR